MSGRSAKRARKSEKEAVYETTGHAVNERAALAKLYCGLDGDKAREREFRALAAKVGYDVPASTWSTWKARARASGTSFSPDKRTGRARALTESEEGDVIGFVEYENQQHRLVQLATVREFIEDELGKKVSQGYVCELLKRLDITSKLAKTRTKGFVITEPELVAEYAGFVVKIGAYDLKGKLIASIDFTFTGHRTSKKRGYSAKGAEGPKLDAKGVRFTNCVVTMVWSDGVNRTPAVLYTYNSDFRVDLQPRKNRDQRIKYLKAEAAKKNISLDRIVYVGKKKGETRTYVKESVDLLKLFFKQYEAVIPKDCLILSDQGSSYSTTENGETVDFLTFMDYNHEFYPVEPHAHISPNDNGVHGPAKATMHLERQDDVKRCLALLNALDKISAEKIKEIFDWNMFLDGRWPTVAEVVAVLHNQKVEKVLERRNLMLKYCKKFKKSLPDLPKSWDIINHGLDGDYWKIE